MATTRDAIAKGSFHWFHPRQIEHPPKGHDLYDPRSEEAPDPHLMALMKEHGWIGPAVQVFPEGGTLYLADGRRRHRAAEALCKAGHEIRIKAEITKAEEPTDAMLVGNMGRKDESPIQLGDKARALVRRGLTILEIAKKFGVTEPTIRNWISLSEAPPEVQAAVQAGEVTATVARDVAKLSAEDRAALLSEAKKDPKALKGAAGKEKAKKGPAAKAGGKIPAGKLRALVVAIPEDADGTEGVIRAWLLYALGLDAAGKELRAYPGGPALIGRLK